MHKNKILSNLNIWAVSFATIFFLGMFSPSLVHAATINLFSDKDTLSIGDTFNVDLKIDSEDASINASQTTLQFDPSIVQVTSISKDDSVFNFWLSEPEFDNKIGKVDFVGGSSSGLSGKSLEILKVSFKVIGSGTISLNLNDSAVTASDGSGTNVLSSVSGLELKSLSKSDIKVIKPTIINKNLDATVKNGKTAVSVPLYPNPANWYNVSSNFLATWSLSKDINGVATALNKIPTFDPSVSEGVFDNKSFPPLSDGVWYLHVRLRDSSGWQTTNHYRISIDTVPPVPFKIDISNGALVAGDSTPTFKYDSTDQTSGILNYVINIDDREPVKTDKGSFTSLPLPPGTHKVKIMAVDKAGNRTESLYQAQIIPIDSPVLVSISKDLFFAEGGLVMSGSALPKISILVDLKDSKGQTVYQTKTMSNDAGLWSLSIDQPLKIGTYSVSVTAENDTGGMSFPVISNNIVVHERPVFIVLGFYVTYKLFSFVSFFLLVGVLLFKMVSDKKKAKDIFNAERDIDFELASIDQIVLEMIEINKEKNQDWESQTRSNFNLTKIRENIIQKKDKILNSIEKLR